MKNLPLDSNKELLNVDNVVTENQISFKNQMKAISDTLYTWFMIRVRVDSNKIKNVIYCSQAIN